LLRRRAGGKRERDDQRQGGEAGHFLHLPEHGGVAMNPP
jgi:hypothetical protein